MEFEEPIELFGNFPEIDVFEDEEDLKISGGNIYAPSKDGETQLHRAIRSGKMQNINTLLNAYQEDFMRVQNWLVSKHQWDVNDKIWLKKTILVAVGEEQCARAKLLENVNIRKEQLVQAVFVLLKHQINSEDVAVLHPEEAHIFSVINQINQLLPNGILSWNYAEKEGKRETYMEAAAAHGITDVMDRLYELGAEIAIPKHNPLIKACEFNRQGTIQWLLTEHFGDFDCTLRDSNDYNALITAMQKNNAKLFSLMLEKMIAYRVMYCKETKSQAFNRIFRFESKDFYSLSIVTFLRNSPSIKRMIENAIVEYELDLAYQWEGITIITDLINHRVALDHCFNYIRVNPEILELTLSGATIVLHDLIRSGHCDFLCEMYQQNPEVKVHFNTEAGYEALRVAIAEANRDKLQFILEHHGEFLKHDIDIFKGIVCSLYYYTDFFEKRIELLKEMIPELHDEIEEARRHIQKENYYNSVSEMEKSFAVMNIDITNVTELPVKETRGLKGETLFHLAVEKDDEEMFKRMLEADQDWIMDNLDNTGNHPVHFVRSVGMLNLIIELHPEGEKIVHRTNHDGHSVLHKVCGLYGNSQSLAMLLERVIECGANANQLTNNGESAAFFVANSTFLEILTKYNIQLDVVNNDNETALVRHLTNWNTSVAKPLLSMTRETPTFKEHAHKYLSLMVSRNRDFFSWEYQDYLKKYPETTKLIFDSLVKHSREEASRVFSRACGGSFNFVVEKFLDGNYDLDYNCKHDYEHTPIIGLLSYMVEPNGHLVKRLLEKSVDLTARNNWGKDALLCLVSEFRSAKTYGHSTETVQLLLDNGAAIDTIDGDGNTLLHLAFQAGEWELVETLIRNGADLKVRNNNGSTPIQMADTLYQELFYFLS